MTCPCDCHASQPQCCEKCVFYGPSLITESMKPYVELPAAEYPPKYTGMEFVESVAFVRGLMEQLKAQNEDIIKRIEVIEASPMMQLKARCNKCGKEVNPAKPEHLCLVPGGVIVNA